MINAQQAQLIVKNFAEAEQANLFKMPDPTVAKGLMELMGQKIEIGLANVKKPVEPFNVDDRVFPPRLIVIANYPDIKKYCDTEELDRFAKISFAFAMHKIGEILQSA